MVVQCSTPVDKKKREREKSKHFDNYYREKIMTAIKKECRSGVEDK